MKALVAACSLFIFHLPSALGQDRQEFLIVTVYGDVRVWALPAGWRPIFKDDQLLLAEGARTKVSDIAAIRPKRGNDTTGYHTVRLLFPMSSAGRELTQTFWIQDRYTHLEQVPREGDFLRIDDRTLLRVGGYREMRE